MASHPEAAQVDDFAPFDHPGLNELNGWTHATFGRLATALGLPHSVLLETTTGYHLGVASRWPGSMWSKWRLGGAMAGCHQLARLHLKAWGRPRHS